MFKKFFYRFFWDDYARKYEIGQKICTAAFSDLYWAVDRRNGRRVVLKILNELGCSIARRYDNSSYAMWEGELLLALDHPNIVNCYECGKSTGYWIAMEPLDYTIFDCVNVGKKNGRNFSLLDVFCDIADALNYLHNEKGLIHGDIAPDNIMIKDGRARLIDFGMSVPDGMAMFKGRAGTPSYMPPEIIRNQGKKGPGPSADIYSFGVVMYELVTGLKVFGGRSKQKRMSRVLNEYPIEPSCLDLQTKCSEELEKIIMDCISKNPLQRPENAKVLVEALGALKKGPKPIRVI